MSRTCSASARTTTRMQKLTVALQGGLQPDITYQYGTSHGAARDRAGHHGPHRPRRTGRGIQLERLLRGRASGGARSTARSSACPRWSDNLAIDLQQGPVRRRPGSTSRPPTGRGTTSVAAAKALTDPATKQQFGVRVPGRRHRGHGVALRRDALGGRRRHPQRRTTLEAAFNSPAGVAGAHHAAADGRHRSESMFLDQQNAARSTTLFNAGNDRHGDQRAVGALGLPGRQLRRADHAGVSTSGSPPDDRRARTSGSLFDNGDAERAAAARTFLAVAHRARSRSKQDSMDDRPPADPQLDRRPSPAS